jgi:hypothetical protein
MAFINAKDVQAIRQELKVAFPAMKFSVRKQHYSQVAVTLLQGDIAFNDLYRTDAYGKDNYVQINQFHTNIKHFVITSLKLLKRLQLAEKVFIKDVVGLMRAIHKAIISILLFTSALTLEHGISLTY